jgi:hypothetical protein
LQVTLVVNYDIPTKNTYPHDPDYELYLHRIGRSGRFGRKGNDFLVNTSWLLWIARLESANLEIFPLQGLVKLLSRVLLPYTNVEV